MTYAKMNDREREAFDKAKAAVVAIWAAMRLMESMPDEPNSFWAIHNKAIEISAAAYNIHNRIYR